MTTFIHCRGCGQRIHATAVSCPECGAPQAAVAPAALTTPSVPERPVLAIVSCAFGVLALVASFDDSGWDRKELVGCVLFSIIALVCGAVVLHHKQPGRTVAIVGLVTGGITLLALSSHF